MANNNLLLLSVESVNLDLNVTDGAKDSVFVSRYTTPNEVYKGSVILYGRCTGKITVYDNDNGTIHIGWTFVKRTHYTHSKQTYLEETRVFIHKSMPVKTIKYNYLPIKL